MRINEAMQVRLSPDCYCAEEWPAPVGAKEQEPRTRWAFRLIPKGERTDTPSRFYIGKETYPLISKVVWYLGMEHYQLKRGEQLPYVSSANPARELTVSSQGPTYSSSAENI
jgi:hypothetical protein